MPACRAHPRAHLSRISLPDRGFSSVEQGSFLWRLIGNIKRLWCGPTAPESSLEDLFTGPFCRTCPQRSMSLGLYRCQLSRGLFRAFSGLGGGPVDRRVFEAPFRDVWSRLEGPSLGRSPQTIPRTSRSTAPEAALGQSLRRSERRSLVQSPHTAPLTVPETVSRTASRTVFYKVKGRLNERPRIRKTDGPLYSPQDGPTYGPFYGPLDGPSYGLLDGPLRGLDGHLRVHTGLCTVSRMAPFTDHYGLRDVRALRPFWGVYEWSRRRALIRALVLTVPRRSF
mmetsp:Transcript_29336/g.101181  ORF Transcript_29336/g.101181 Transcript_29336/m.101181 type:complete len:282 (+) Transcript_29336:488-1333(+)